MTALVLPPDAARAVVGERCDGWACCPGRPHKHGCTQPENDPVARFIPSDTPDRYQPGEWIEVRTLTRTAMAGLCVDIDGEWWHEPGSCRHCGQTVGRVRLGEAVPVLTVPNHGPHSEPSVLPAVEVTYDGRLTHWYHHDAGWRDITVPHLTFWQDAFTPGTWAHEIIERSAL